MLGPAVEEGQQHRSCEALKPAQPWPLSQVIEKMEREFRITNFKFLTKILKAGEGRGKQHPRNDERKKSSEEQPVNGKDL